MYSTKNKLVEEDYTDFDLESDFSRTNYSLTTTSPRTDTTNNSTAGRNFHSSEMSETHESAMLNSRNRSFNSPFMSAFQVYTRLVPIFLTFATVCLFLGIVCFFIFHAVFSSSAPVSKRAPVISSPGINPMRLVGNLLSIPPQLPVGNELRPEDALVKIHELFQEPEIDSVLVGDDHSDANVVDNGQTYVNPRDISDDSDDSDAFLEDNLFHVNTEEGIDFQNGSYRNLLGNSACQIPILPTLVSSGNQRFQPCKAQEDYGIENAKECCYQVVQSRFYDYGQLDLWKTLVCTPFDPEDKETQREIENFEFTRLRCQNFPTKRKGSRIKTELRANIPLSSPLVRNKIQHWVDQPPSAPRPFNLLIIGLDGISRQLFSKNFQRTTKVLKALEFTDLKGYHILGSKSLDNIIPLLMGVNRVELPKICNHRWKSHWDNCPFIWKDFSDQNYVTMYAEDVPDAFNFGGQVGFEKAPTDFYLRPILVEKLHLDGNGNCFGNQTASEFILNYGKRFMDKFQQFSTPYFAFIWLNLPRNQRGTDNQNVDRILYRFFKKLPHLNNTILLMLSDHGIQSGSYRTTSQGFLDHRLPVMFLRYPPGAQEFETVRSILKLNSESLLTPFDVHYSLKSIANNSLGTLKKQEVEEPPRINIFSTVNLNRTCQDAGIGTHWCTCGTIIWDERNLGQSREFLLVKNKKLIPNVMKKINEMVNIQRESLIITKSSASNACPELHFEKLLYIGRRNETNSKSQDADVIIFGLQVQPTGAQFEAFVKGRENKWETVLPILRIDSLGGHNYCVRANKRAHFQ